MDFSDFISKPQKPAFSLSLNKPLESVLVADCGSNTTRVVLIDIVDNAYRFIARGEAPSTLEAPYSDVTIGVLNAIAAIEANTGRHLLIGGQLITPQQEDGSGVDALVASSSAAEALRVVAAGLVKDLSARTCARASHGTYTTVLDTISLDDYGDEAQEGNTTRAVTATEFKNPDAEFSPFAKYSEFGQETPKENNKRGGSRLFGDRKIKYWRERQIAKLRRLDPNVIVLSGGNGKVVEPLLRLVDVIVEASRQEMVLANATGENHHPTTLLFAGNAEAQEAVIERVGGQVEFYGIDNIRPGGVFENLNPLQHQLAALYQERLLPTLPGYSRLSHISSAPINTTCSAVGLMTQFLARDVADNRVLTADIGGANSALFHANDQNFVSLVRGNFGLSFGLSNILAEVGVESIQRWLPFEAKADEIVHYALNKTLRPQVLPADERELMIEGAFVRQALHRMYEELSIESSNALDFNRLVGLGGPLVNAQPWQAALMLLDGIEPVGSVTTGLLELELDTTMLMAAAGALASFDANMATYVFRYDCLHRLGPCIVPLGEASVGSHAVTVTLTTHNGRTRKAEVPYGSIAILPLQVEEQASLEIVPSRNFKIGQAARGMTVRTEPGQEVSGGLVGLIIDARGRPLKLSDNPETCRQNNLKWQKAYTDMLAMLENEQVQATPVVSTNSRSKPKPTPVATVESSTSIPVKTSKSLFNRAKEKKGKEVPEVSSTEATTTTLNQDTANESLELRQAMGIKGKSKLKKEKSKAEK